MGWVWKDDSGSNSASTGEFHGLSIPKDNGNSSGERYATRKVVTSKCRTEEVEPGKFIQKCEKTEQIFKDCAGRPSKVVESIKEYSEEDVTDNMVNGSFPLEPADADHGSAFHFPGLRSDLDAIERSFFGGMSRLFDAADEMRNTFFNSAGIPDLFNDKSSSLHNKHGNHVESGPPNQALPSKNTDGEVDLSGLTKDV